MGLLWILVSECVKLVYTRNYADFETALWTRGMRENVVIIKLFQACAVRYSGNPLENLADHIPYDSSEVEIPDIPDVTLHSVLGSGVVALTYDATLGGRPVVVKVKRRGIDARIHRDLHVAQWWMWTISWVPGLSVVHDAFAEVQDLLRTQLDFTAEAKSQIEYKRMLSNAHIVVPEVHEHLCTDSILVMQKLDGKALSEISTSEREKYATWMAQAVFASIMHGLIHADMHVGNVVFMPNAIGIIDFGLTMRLSASDHIAYVGIIQDMVICNYAGIAEKIVDTILLPTEKVEGLDSKHKARLLCTITKIAESILSDHPTIRVADIVQIGREVRPFGLSITPTIYRLVVSMAAHELLIRKITTRCATELYR